jgi:hypothetical protein
MPRDGSGISEGTRHAWQGMKQRCTNPNFRQWKDYGGRGISVQFSSVEEFLAEVGERPPGLTIDRIDNDGDYAPGNVRWATRAEQQRNRRNALFVEIDGKRHRVMDLAKQSGLKPDTIVARAKKGLSLDAVLSPEKLRDLSGLALGGKASGAKTRLKTHCIKGHEFTPENTYITPQGWRNCRACQNAKMRNRYATARRKYNHAA